MAVASEKRNTPFWRLIMYSLFLHHSRSKIKWPVHYNRRIQAPMQTQIFRSLCAQEHALRSAALFRHTRYMLRKMLTAVVSTQAAVFSDVTPCSLADGDTRHIPTHAPSSEPQHSHFLICFHFY
jgi:hypothetical protein